MHQKWPSMGFFLLLFRACLSCCNLTKKRYLKHCFYIINQSVKKLRATERWWLANALLSFQLHVAGERRMKRRMSFYWETFFCSQHCDSPDGWSPAPVRISWRGNAPDRVCREAARAQELAGRPGGGQQESLLCVVQSGDIAVPWGRCLRSKTTWLLDCVWGMECGLKYALILYSTLSDKLCIYYTVSLWPKSKII